ncbi:DUF421 domain-containing protein [Kroppenstedtia pulmonis]|uniref:DUF421 domain-containing protein n=1 Tax=Kroppenstedtia pulmonis TaxID=1380685 RepID=UPI001FEC463B|nr:DUF421 domain-containing protein [Kroppenstedtia pulmonis]
MDFLTTLAKLLLLFSLTIAVIRSMGKSAIAQLTPYDLVAIVIIGTVASEPLISTDWLPTVVTLIMITLLYHIFAKLTLHRIGNRLLLGKPSILIKHGQIIEHHLQQNNVSLIQLLALLRTSGYPDLSKIDYAILEPTGSVSIIPKPDVAPLSPQDIGLPLAYEGLPLDVIIDGHVQHHNLKLIGKDTKWLYSQLKKQQVTNVKDVIYAAAKEKTDGLLINLREGKRKE